MFINWSHRVGYKRVISSFFHHKALTYNQQHFKELKNHSEKESVHLYENLKWVRIINLYIPIRRQYYYTHVR